MSELNGALYNAIYDNDLTKVKELVENGASVTSASMLMIVERGYLDILKYYVSQGADVTEDGNIALKLAARAGKLDIVKYLVEQGADASDNDNTAAKWASLNGNMEVVNYLVSISNDTVTLAEGLVKAIPSLSRFIDSIHELESVIPKLIGTRSEYRYTYGVFSSISVTNNTITIVTPDGKFTLTSYEFYSWELRSIDLVYVKKG